MVGLLSTTSAQVTNGNAADISGAFVPPPSPQKAGSQESHHSIPKEKRVFAALADKTVRD
jgi:hypothetical protein